MIKQNTENSNSQLLAAQKSSSNTPLFLHLPLSLSTNSFNSSLPTLIDSHFTLNLLSIHLDYLRVSTSNLTKKSLSSLIDYIFSGLNTKTINKPWHPHFMMPKSKKYDYRIVSPTGITLAIKKKAKYKGKNARYVYDIMIDFTGAYFANLSLLKQLELIYYLNTNFKLICHRLDVAIDDYSKELFPLLQIVVAVEMGNHFGFTEMDEEYLYCRSEGCIGTLALGSRRSEHYVIIYTVHKFFYRWEAELKQNKAQELFDNLNALAIENSSGTPPTKVVLKALFDAAISEIDFRDKNKSGSPKNATRKRTNRLSFWSNTLTNILLSIEIPTVDKAETISQTKTKTML